MGTKLTAPLANSESCWCVTIRRVDAGPVDMATKAADEREEARTGASLGESQAEGWRVGRWMAHFVTAN